ncbi:MAG: aldo/keto reductase, partial [Armatimonadota bacterium]
MQYREYGDTSKMLSALGFGAMRLPDDDEYAVQIMERFLDLGGNLIDTAACYGSNGRSERLVGRAIEGRRDEVFISTKNHAVVQGTRDDSTDIPEAFEQYMEQSFENLGVDRIDLYHIHDFSWEQFTEHFDDKPPLEMCQQALADGRIDHLCFSSHDTPENIIRLIDTGLFEGVIVQYNMLDQPGSGGPRGGTANAPAIAHAADKGLGVLIMGPLAGGRLLMGDPEKLKEMLPVDTPS